MCSPPGRIRQAPLITEPSLSQFYNSDTACFLDQQSRQYKACHTFWGSRSLGWLSSRDFRSSYIPSRGFPTLNPVISLSHFLTLDLDPADIQSLRSSPLSALLTIARPSKKLTLYVQLPCLLPSNHLHVPSSPSSSALRAWRPHRALYHQIMPPRAPLYTKNTTSPTLPTRPTKPSSHPTKTASTSLGPQLLPITRQLSQLSAGFEMLQPVPYVRALFALTVSQPLLTEPQ